MKKSTASPFFSRILPSLCFWAAAAVCFSLVAVLDTGIFPLASWSAGKPAPLTIRTAAEDSSVSAAAGADILVRRGQQVDKSILGNVSEHYRRHHFSLDWLLHTGVLTLLVLVIFHSLLLRLKTKMWLRFRTVFSMMMATVLALLLSRLLLSLSSFSTLASPLAFPAILMATWAPIGLAFGAHLLTIVLAGILLPLAVGPLFVELAAGWTTIMLLGRQNGFGRITIAALGGAAAGWVFSALLAWEGFSYLLSLSQESRLVGMATGMLGSGLLAWLLGPLLLRLSGGVSRNKVRSLLELDRPLLKELSEKAPGTFQHSMAMANMAEKVAQDIGADADLVRAGAYYHDIGKMRHPEMFIENQEKENPHDHLRPEESAAKLRAHIYDGVALARAANLPVRLIDFIVEHHGTSLMDFFFDLAARQSGSPPNPAHFRYDGRNPTSRETAILMIVDSVEAASRTLSEPTSEEVASMVRRILFDKLQAGLLDDSGLTSEDLKNIASSLIRIVHAQFHLRVPYPWQRRSEVSGIFRVPRPVTDPHLRVARPLSEEKLDIQPLAAEIGPSQPPVGEEEK